MKSLAYFSLWLAISLCISLPGRAQTASARSLHQKDSKDSIQVQVESTPQLNNANTFKLLPRYDQQKDTAGFKFIPKDQGDADYVPYDKEPTIIKKVEPKYPQRALSAGIEGKVNVKMWVDTDGKVKKVEVLKSDFEIFNDAAVAAAKQFIFAPAYVNNQPVAVWVAYPFEFTLHKKGEKH
jgi:TonB family protein